MGDKGFLIQAEFREKGIAFHVPSFLGSDRPQFSKEELLVSEDISTVRVHVERIIQRIRCYHILDGKLPLSMKPVAEQLFTVCSFLTNFQSPIVKS